MSAPVTYPVQLDFHADRRISRWHPLVQWVLAVPHILIAQVLSRLRSVLTFISFFTVLFTERIPRALFDMIAMTYRYEWRAMSYALFLHEDYPPFDFRPSSADDGVEPHTTLSIRYPDRLSRWKPLYKWFIAIPHYLVMVVLGVASIGAVLIALVTVLFTGQYPAALREFVVGAYRYGLRVEAYVGLLTDEYPPFRLAS